MKNRTRTAPSAAGVSLHLRVWEPNHEFERLGAVILVHGLGEHSGRYAHVARFFADRGLSVYGIDLVGFGRSGGRRGDVPGGLDTFVADVHRVTELAASDLGESARLILLGHSMGGLTVLRHLLDHPDAVSEAIVCGPALNSGRDVSAARKVLVRTLSRTLPFVTFDHGYAAEEMSTDPAVVSEYTSDPLVHRRISTRLAISIIDEGARVRASAAEFNPAASMLFLQGRQDTVADPDDTRSFGERVSCEHKEVVVLPGMRHEVFNEQEKAKTFEAVDRFLGLSSG